MKTSFRIKCSALFLVIGFAASAQYVEKLADLNQMGALKLAEQAKLEAQKLDKNVITWARTIQKLREEKHILPFQPKHQVLN